MMPIDPIRRTNPSRRANAVRWANSTRLKGAHVVLGVTGGIACYKAVDLASKLVQAGATVDVIMTEGATRFVTPLPFQTITGRPVSVDMFQLLRDTDMAHISLSARADVMVIAPATANTIAKIAHGLADNLLTGTVLALPAGGANATPLIIAPAMDADMWANPATVENVETLRRRGATIVGPGKGRLASGRIGAGRLVTTEELIAADPYRAVERGVFLPVPLPNGDRFIPELEQVETDADAVSGLQRFGPVRRQGLVVQVSPVRLAEVHDADPVAFQLQPGLELGNAAARVRQGQAAVLGPPQG